MKKDLPTRLGNRGIVVADDEKGERRMYGQPSTECETLVKLYIGAKNSNRHPEIVWGCNFQPDCFFLRVRVRKIFSL
jgi:hypothetical protein